MLEDFGVLAEILKQHCGLRMIRIDSYESPTYWKLDATARIGERDASVNMEYIVPSTHTVPNVQTEEVFDHSCTMVGHYIVLVGGCRKYNKFRNTDSTMKYMLNLKTEVWQRLELGGVSFGRSGHIAILREDQVLVFGGNNTTQLLFALDLMLMESRIIPMKYNEPPQRPPPSRKDARGGLIEQLDVLVIWGGREANGTENATVQCMEFRLYSWYQPVCKGESPQGRHNHASCVDGRSMYISGGIGPGSLLLFHMHQ